MSAECSSTPSDAGDPVTPEDVGKKAAMTLLQEIFKVNFNDLMIFRAALNEKKMAIIHCKLGLLSTLNVLLRMVENTKFNSLNSNQLGM